MTFLYISWTKTFCSRQEFSPAVFLFKHANSKQMEAWKGEGEDRSAAHFQMSMLTSWLPLLCRASNGTDTPILSSGERAEMVRVLEEMIEKLGWEQQEDVMALWLHHFMSCPDSDWPNLESCYIRWYSESRKLLFGWWILYYIITLRSIWTWTYFSHVILVTPSIEDFNICHPSIWDDGVYFSVRYLDLPEASIG